MYVMPPSAVRGDSTSDFFVLLTKVNFRSNKVWYKVTLCENFQQHSCSMVIPLPNGR